MASEERATLIPPPPRDPNKAPIENTLEVTELGVLGKDIFTNTRKAWHPTGARGIYGGTVIAQCLASAQRTVPEGFLVHSCHCYFLLAGAGGVPILFHVERVRDGRSFATRTVQARQRGSCIFTTTVSFVRPGAGGEQTVRHGAPLPADAGPPPPDPDDDHDSSSSPSSSSSSSPSSSSSSSATENEAGTKDQDKSEPAWARGGPFRGAGIHILRGDDDAARPDERKCRQWVRCRGKISSSGGHQAHLNALAYMSDSYFIGTISRIHRLWRFPVAADDVERLPRQVRSQLTQLAEREGMGSDVQAWRARPVVGMQVSLDHSIYFHEPLRVRADDWLFTEMESPWAGDGRGVVLQRIFAKDGTLLATCVQEGVVRLKQTQPEGSSKL